MASNTASSHNSWQPILKLHVCGRDWFLERAADLETLWEQMDVFNDDERVPYWTEVWPSSLVLGEWLLAHRDCIAGQRALDMGCGIGLTTLIGRWLGADVIGMDYEPEALHFARKNAIANGVPMPDLVVMDWRSPAVRPRSLPCIWAGDIMYERRFAQSILNFIDYALAPNGVVWIAEPCRSVYDMFRTTLVNRRWGCRCACETSVPAIYPQEKPVPVRIWEISR